MRLLIKSASSEVVAQLIDNIMLMPINAGGHVPINPVDGIMQSQDLITIETMFAQCLQTLIAEDKIPLQPRTIAIATAMYKTLECLGIQLAVLPNPSYVQFLQTYMANRALQFALPTHNRDLIDFRYIVNALVIFEYIYSHHTVNGYTWSLELLRMQARISQMRYIL